MPESMAGLRGGFNLIFYDFQHIFRDCMKVSIVSALIFIDSIVSVHRIYERRNTPLLVRSVIRWKKVRIFARRTSDLLRVISLILYLRSRRTTDRTSDVASSTEPLTESIVV
jgi:hypothetical protein